MIDIEKLKDILEGYKTYFPGHFNDEKYKWEAVKCFQDNWNIDAPNFGDMFRIATDKTDNLLTSGYVYPRGMILNFAKADDEATRQMFRNLYDESRDLGERVDDFQSVAETLRAKYDDGTWKNHYQSINAVSTYLWLRFPDKYYIYKYELYKNAATELAADYKPKRNGSADNMTGGFQMYDEICKAIAEDAGVVAMVQSALTESCYPDPKFKTLTVDVGFYLSRFYLDDMGRWFPKDYSPRLSVKDWVELLNNNTVFTLSSLQILKRMKDYGGQATCKQLSIKYGESSNFYNVGSSALARRVAKKSGCPVMTKDTENSKWWPILYIGKYADSHTDGIFIWRIRDELSSALDQVDLTGIPLYADTIPGGVVPKYTKKDFLGKVYMTEERFDVLKALLSNKMNIILQGAPGVGKTFTAKKLAYAMMGEMDDSHIEMVQFHQNYSYEDFMLGYRPEGTDFKLTKGVFFRFCQKAANDPNKDYFFIIDEINRGNMSKIFGEVLMLIENDKRGPKNKITLVYNELPFYVPENLYIIGMMNTADRSLAMMDYALRRRFSFFEMEPGFSSEGFRSYQAGLASETFDTLMEQIKALNKEIAEDESLGNGFRIGHSYFCGLKPETCIIDQLHSIVEFDILPLLSEYWFDEPAKVQRWEQNLRGVFDD